MTTRHVTGTDLVKVAQAHDQDGAELLQDLLEAEQIPSLVPRAPGSGGARDVLVVAHDAELAREVLHTADLDAAATPAARPTPSPVLAGILIAIALVAAAVCVAVDVLA
jgi:hypothetical protein